MLEHIHILHTSSSSSSSDFPFWIISLTFTLTLTPHILLRGVGDYCTANNRNRPSSLSIPFTQLWWCEIWTKTKQNKTTIINNFSLIWLINQFGHWTSVDDKSNIMSIKFDSDEGPTRSSSSSSSGQNGKKIMFLLL